MQIEKNIAATLRHRMEAEKKSKLEFSKELGIPRSTFQGYLKGENCLRSDSIEEIAKGLNITPAQLISGPEDAAAESLRLETLLPQIPALHPQAQRLAKDAIALLQTAFRVSQELMCIDAHASEQDAPEGAYRYFLQETWQPARMRCSYGLLGQQRQSGCWTDRCYRPSYGPMCGLPTHSSSSKPRRSIRAAHIPRERSRPRRRRASGEALHHPAARPRPPVRRHPRLPRPGSRDRVNVTGPAQLHSEEIHTGPDAKCRRRLSRASWKTC